MTAKFGIPNRKVSDPNSTPTEQSRTVTARRMGLVVEATYGPKVDDEQPTNVYEYENTPENRSWAGALPVKQGLYDPELEKDACGVGFAA